MRPIPASCAIALVASLSALQAGAQARLTATSAEPLVEVEGHGEAHVAPDRATVTLVVVTKGPSASHVAGANARLQHAVIDTLRAMGFGPTATSTMSYNVSPNYEESPSGRSMHQVGYIARNAVRVRLTELDRIGAVIDAGLARGATGVEGVEFAASNTDEAQQTATTQASARAHAEAVSLAAALGGSLGAFVDATTASAIGDVSPRKQAYAGRALSPDGTSISPTEITVESSVVARWRFVPKP